MKKYVLGLLLYFSIMSLIPISIYVWGYKIYPAFLKWDINNIDDVKVINIWGHHDNTLEEIAARIDVKGKENIVLNNLSYDVFNYPEDVFLSEINGKSFELFEVKDSSISRMCYLNVGTNSYLHDLLPYKFNSVKNVIQHYDAISDVIDDLPTFPTFKKIPTETSDIYIAIQPTASQDIDPFYLNFCTNGFRALLEKNKEGNLWVSN